MKIMAKEFTHFLKVCKLISNYSIYILVALVPILFLPITSDILDFNKQAVVIFLVFLSLFAQMVNILVSGKISLNLNKTHIAVIVLFLIYLVSTIFSQDKYGSFWGWPRVTSESLLTLICFSLLYFIISNIFSKKEIFISIVVFTLSCLLAVLFGMLQLFGLFIIPFDFAKLASFNTIGSVGNFGIFLAVLLPLLIVFEIVVSKKWLRIVYGIGIAVSIISLLLINYPLIWWSILISSVLFIAFGVFKRNFFDLRWLSIPIFFFVLALFFIIVNPLIGVYQRPVEIYLNQSSTLDIALKTIKDKPILGSGPGTFIFDFSKYRKQEFNQSPLWSLRFDAGASKVLTNLTTTGILGLLALLALIGSVTYYGIVFITRETEGINGTKIKIIERDSVFRIIISGVFISFLVQAIIYFLYSSSFSLDFTFFFLIACFIGLISERKEYNLSPSSFLTLGFTLLFTLVFIFGLGLIILEGQRYIAEVNYKSGILAFASGQKEKGTLNFEKAISQNSNVDIYLTDLSQAYLSLVSDLIAKKDLSNSEKERLSVLLNNSINASKIATEVNPNNVSNWAIHAFVYQNLIGIFPGSEDWAIKSYDKASSLDSKNPYYLTQKGIVFLTKAYGVDKDSAQAKKQDLDSAKIEFDKAIQLKSDYALARFQLAMVLQAQGKTDQVMPALQEAKKYALNDVGLSFQIGILYYQDKDYKNAQAEFERTISLNPDYANALYFLSLTYSALGQNGKAISTITKVLKLNPENQEVKKVLENLNNGIDPLSGIKEEVPAQLPVEDEVVEKK
jgi:tetratricopeptide (TPR) repeat protein